MRFRALIPLWLKLALRDLLAAPTGFGVFVGCIALGVMAITAVQALSDGLGAGFMRQGRVLLGGDVTFVRPHIPATSTERERLSALGKVSETASLRTLARRPDGGGQALAEVKGVDEDYPLAGAVAIAGGGPIGPALAAGQAIVDPLLLERLRLKPGDTIRLGETEVPIAAPLVSEPDAVGDRATFGPRVLVSLATLKRSGLVQPGTLIRWRYGVLLPRARAAASAAELKAITDGVKRDLPQSGFITTDRLDPSPQLTRTLERLRQFLTLIGLASLLVGGVGVANAVQTFIERRRKTIAIFKSLGAPRGLVFRMLLAQVIAVTVVGIGIGIVFGLAVPELVSAFAGKALPVELSFNIAPSSIGLAAGYGLLTAMLYALWPLGRAEQIAPSVLFRDDVAPSGERPRLAIMLATGAVAALLIGVVVATSDAKLVALSFCGGMAAVLGVLALAGRFIPMLARALPRFANAEASFAVQSIAAPGGLAASVLLSLGIGLSLLIAIALVDVSLESELNGRLPEAAPAYFVLDLPKSERAAFSAAIESGLPGSVVQSVPMLRGRLVAVKDTPVEALKVAPDAAWALSGDRGLTFAERVPEGSRIVAGEWWAGDYAGEPLVSFETELAKQLGVGVGDTVTVNVLGRNLTARIASLREVKWDSLALNFVMVFSPNALEAAPFKLLATIRVPAGTSLEAEAALSNTLSAAFPTATPIRVRDAIAQFNDVLAKVLTAFRVASSVTLIAGALVLAGALATAQRRRILNAVILKALGVTRGRILLSHAIEYGLLALLAALLATVLGGLAAWVTVHKVMHIDLVFSLTAIAEALTLALLLAGLFGGIGTWAVLRAPAVSYLKSE